MTKQYYKIVRDNIPDILDKNENVESYKIDFIKNSKQFLEMLVQKLVEEAMELKEELELTDEIPLDELVDVIEVVNKLKHESRFDSLQIEEARKEKARKNGAFDTGTILLSVTDKDNDEPVELNENQQEGEQ